MGVLIWNLVRGRAAPISDFCVGYSELRNEPFSIGYSKRGCVGTLLIWSVIIYLMVMAGRSTSCPRFTYIPPTLFGADF